MILLIDENLSPQLADFLQDIFPGSLHLETVGLLSTEDDDIWEYARSRNLVVMTKDSDYRRLSLEHGHPPKVILIRIGNCRVREVESLVRDHYDEILAFEQDPARGIIEFR